MIDVSKKSWQKYLLFGSLYFSEGIQAALSTVIIPIYLLEKGYSLPIVTLVTGIASAPWYLKFLIGPTTDYFYQYGRKPFIIIGGLLGALSLFVLLALDPSGSLIPFTLVLFLSHLGIIYLDVSCDGWAVQISKQAERGKISGAMFAGLFAGMAFGTSVLASIAQLYGYGMSFLAGGGIILVLIIYPFLVKEAKLSEKRPPIALLLKQEFTKRGTQLVAIFGFASSIGFGIIFFVIPLYMKTILHMDIGQIGLLTTIYPITIVIGSLCGGMMTDRWSRKSILSLIMCASIVFYAALIYATTWQILAILYAVIGFLDGGYLATGSALIMDVTNPKIGATQYSILASICNFGEYGGGTVSGTLVAMLGFGRVFLYSAWTLGPALLILYFIRLKKNEIFS